MSRLLQFLRVELILPAIVVDDHQAAIRQIFPGDEALHRAADQFGGRLQAQTYRIRSNLMCSVSSGYQAFVTSCFWLRPSCNPVPKV